MSTNVCLKGAEGMAAFFKAQRKWSYETFGPPEFKGPIGPLRHLEKEAKEAYEETDTVKQREEIADCLFLVFDAAHRAGLSYEELVDEAVAKLAKNRKRTWPEWRGTDPNNPMEHDRSKD